MGKVYGGGGGYGRCDGRVEMNGLKGVPTGLEEGVEKRRMAHEEKQRGDNKSVVRDGSRGCNCRWDEGMVGVVLGGGVGAAAAVVEGRKGIGSGGRVAMAGN